MGIENSATYKSVNPIVLVGKAIKEVFVVSSAFITSVDGLYYISDLALSVFALADRLIESAPKSLHRTIQIMRGHPALHNTILLVRGYMDITCILDIINRGRDWSTQDENGKYIWERGYSTIGYYVSLTISDAANHLYLLDKFKYIILGTVAKPVSIIYNTATISQQIFDIASTYLELQKAVVDLAESRIRHLIWQCNMYENPEVVRSQIAEKLKKWQLRVNEDLLRRGRTAPTIPEVIPHSEILGEDAQENDFLPSERKNLEKRNKWYVRSIIKDDHELYKFVDNMIIRTNIKEKNCSYKVLTTYCSLVCTISYLALLLLSAVSVCLIMSELFMPIAILSVIVNAMYVADFIVEHYFKALPTPELYTPQVYRP